MMFMFFEVCDRLCHDSACDTSFFQGSQPSCGFVLEKNERKWEEKYLSNHLATVLCFDFLVKVDINH